MIIDTLKRTTFEDIQIERFGERYRNYRRTLRSSSMLLEVPDFPPYIMLEQTLACNLSCPSCILGDAAAAQPFKMRAMRREMYDLIIDEAAKTNFAPLRCTRRM